MNIPAALTDHIDPEATAVRLRQRGIDVAQVETDYVRFKPDDTTIISYLLTRHDGSSERGYTRWCNNTSEADDIEAKARTFRMTTSSLGGATTRIDANSIFYPFPNDARLRRMRWHTTPRKWKRTLEQLVPRPMQLSGSLSHADVLRYKPERRVIVAAHLSTTNGHKQSVLIRYATSNQATWLAQIARSLLRFGIDTPRPLMQLDDGRVSVEEFIEADELRTAVCSKRARPSNVARAICAFHTSPVEAPSRHAREELAQAQNGLRGLARWCTSIEDLADALGRQLMRTVPIDTDRDVLLHGDLHDRNIMLRPDGTVTFVDLERVARGPAVIDLGQLRGAGIAAGIRHPELSVNAAEFAEQVVDTYRCDEKRPSNDRAIAWHTAVALTAQALLAARHLETDWENNVEALLELALAEVADLEPA
jgi:thiamine kinase-like enzyme